MAEASRPYGLTEHVARLEAENERLRALIRELADECETWVQHHYQVGEKRWGRTPEVLHHVERRRYERDMRPVERARKEVGDAD